MFGVVLLQMSGYVNTVDELNTALSSDVCIVRANGIQVFFIHVSAIFFCDFF